MGYWRVRAGLAQLGHENLYRSPAKGSPGAHQFHLFVAAIEDAAGRGRMISLALSAAPNPRRCGFHSGEVVMIHHGGWPLYIVAEEPLAFDRWRGRVKSMSHPECELGDVVYFHSLDVERVSQY